MLDTVDSVITAVGGSQAAASLAGVSLPAIWNWRARGKIAQGKFVLFRDALAVKGLEASPAVFGMKSKREVDEVRP